MQISWLQFVPRRVRVFDGPGYEPARAMPTEPSAATAEDVNASMVVHSDYLRRRP
jgi:hypothetical protein